jgi:hypothetical protein
MAARKIRTRLNEHWRERIRTSMLINRLQDHSTGKIEMTPTQIKATEILLKKTAPDLLGIAGDPNGPAVKTEVLVRFQGKT